MDGLIPEFPIGCTWCGMVRPLESAMVGVVLLLFVLVVVLGHACIHDKGACQHGWIFQTMY